MVLVNNMVCLKFITVGHKQENQCASEEKMKNLEKQLKKIIKQQQANSKNMQTLCINLQIETKAYFRVLISTLIITLLIFNYIFSISI